MERGVAELEALPAATVSKVVGVCAGYALQHVHREHRIHMEAVMAAPPGIRLLMLGWQTWAIVVVVLALVLLAGVFVLTG